MMWICEKEIILRRWTTRCYYCFEFSIKRVHVFNVDIVRLFFSLRTMMGAGRKEKDDLTMKKKNDDDDDGLLLN